MDRQGTGPQYSGSGGGGIGIYRPGRDEQLFEDAEYSVDDDNKAIALSRIRRSMDNPPATVERDVRRYFRERGVTLRIEKRRLHAEYLAAGDQMQAANWAPGRRYYCVDLMHDGHLVDRRYGVALTKGAALLDAQFRFIKDET